MLLQHPQDEDEFARPVAVPLGIQPAPQLFEAAGQLPADRRPLVIEGPGACAPAEW
jgi:hypothetical protein